MSSLSSIASALATGFSFALFFSPFKTISEIKTQGDTQGINFNPFFAMFMNGCINGLYGLVMYNGTVILVNWSSVILCTYYLYIFFSYTRDLQQRNRIRLMILCGVVFVFALAYHATYIAGEYAQAQVGLLGNAASIIMFASPLSTLRTVLQSRDASSIPLTLSSASLACCLSWVLFGFSIGDPFVIGPNVLGALLSLAQLALVWQFGQKKKPVLPVRGV